MKRFFLILTAIIMISNITAYAERNTASSSVFETMVGINKEYYKYFDYTDEQLKNEYKSEVISIEETEFWSRTTTVYYDGEVDFVKLWEGGPMMAESSSESNTIRIYVADMIRGDEVERDIWLEVRAKSLISGMGDHTTADDLRSIGNVSIADVGAGGYEFHLNVAYTEGGKSYTLSQWICSSGAVNNIVKDLDETILSHIGNLVNSDYELADQKMSEYIMPKLINPDSYLILQRWIHKN